MRDPAVLIVFAETEMAPSTSAVEVVLAYQDAWTRRDFDAARRYVADDVVFRSSAGQHIVMVDPFFTMLSAFAQRIEPRWEKVAVLPDELGVLILYRLFTLAAAPAFCSDYFVVRDGKIVSDTLVFDPEPFTRPVKK